MEKKDIKDKFKVLEKYRITGPLGNPLATKAYSGNTGCFMYTITRKGMKFKACCIASEDFGWEHVSISLMTPQGADIMPSWDIMCNIKEMFWGDEARVIQFHPPKSEYVNNHAKCLHLWRSKNEKQPFPDSVLVGLRDN
jgi:hypothetical protein